MLLVLSLVNHNAGRYWSGRVEAPVSQTRVSLGRSHATVLWLGIGGDAGVSVPICAALGGLVKALPESHVRSRANRAAPLHGDLPAVAHFRCREGSTRINAYLRRSLACRFVALKKWPAKMVKIATTSRNLGPRTPSLLLGFFRADLAEWPKQHT